MERTLIVFKPDALQRGIVGEVLSRFEKVGLKMIGLKMMAPDRDHFHAHYEGIGGVKTRHGEDVFNVTLFNMMEGPVVASVLEGIHAVDLVRKMVGSTEPGKALPGTIRGDYAQSSFAYANSDGKTLPNVLHASATTEEAEAEIALWFSAPELYNYETAHQRHVHGSHPPKK